MERHLWCRATTGELVGDFATQFVYPNRFRYSALAALDHFRDVALLDGTTPDPRLLAAVDVVRAAQATDSTWRQGTQLPGKTWFDVDVPAGEASKWLTLWGIRVLDWWDANAPEPV